jgi:PAS domain S-box-containing protein
MNTQPEIQNSALTLTYDVQFTDLFSLEEIQRLQDLFSDATGVASIITYPDGTPITRPSNFCRLCNSIIRKTEKGRINCFKSDALLGRHNPDGPVIQPCLSGGLMDAGSSITVAGRHIANWLIGQVQNEELDKQKMIDYAMEIGADYHEFLNALAEVPVMTLKQFTHVSNMLHAYTRELSEKAYNNLLLKMQIVEREKANLQMAALHKDLVISEKFLLEVQKITRLGTYILDIETGIWKSSEILDSIFGIDDTYEKTVEGWAAVIHPDWQQIMVDYFVNHVLGTSGRFDKEYKIIRLNDLEERWVHGLGEVKYNEASRPITMIGTIRDITEQKLAAESISMLAHAIRSISECVSITDMCDKIIFVNYAFLKTYQYSEKELLGNSISMVRSPNNDEAVIARVLPETLDGGWHGELLNKKKDGTEFPVFVSSSVIRDENNKPIALIGVTADITIRKQSEKRILELNEELDHRVKQRTAELEAAIHELETFSYSVSHDLKTPLRHIQGFTGLLLENESADLSPEDREHLNNISRSSDDMAKLIDALLSFSRLNQTALKKVRIQSSKMVQQVIKFFEPDLQNRNITFQTGPLPDVEGDEGLIRQVWTNLISNAIKYTGKKTEATILIGSISDACFTTFFIKDNGAGFNMKYANKLFRVFQRLHKSREFEGVGIGLANVNRIIHRHGGHCRAEGEPDKGATFYFSIPSL